MKIVAALALIIGAIGWTLLIEPGGMQVAAADGMPRQISQLGR